MHHCGSKPGIVSRAKALWPDTRSSKFAKEISAGHFGAATELTAYDLSAGCVGSCSQANYLLRNSAMDDSVGGS